MEPIEQSLERCAVSALDVCGLRILPREKARQGEGHQHEKPGAGCWCTRALYRNGRSPPLGRELGPNPDSRCGAVIAQFKDPEGHTVGLVQAA